MSNRRVRRSRLAAAAGLAVLVAAVAGCSDSPEQCTHSDLGYFVLRAPAHEGNYLMTVSGVLTSVDKLPATNPPLVQYLIASDSGGEVRVAMDDLGYLFPVQVDSTYTLQFEDFNFPGGSTHGYSIVIWNASGEFVALLATDYEPQYLVFRGSQTVKDLPPGPGYPIDGLQVFFSDEGCTPRVLNTKEYRDITNRVLEFKIGASQVRLFHGERGSVGAYEAEVFRAQAMIIKEPASGVPLPAEQISYVLESKAALTLPRAGP